MSSRGVNKVILVGNLGQDPEIRYMNNGNAVANISLATSESWTDKQTGEKKEKTEWHRIVAYPPLAEIIGEYVFKGSKIYCEGKLQTSKWQNQEGVDQYSTEIIIHQMQMLDSRQYGDNSNQAGAGQAQGQPQQRPQQRPPQRPQQQQRAAAKQGQSQRPPLQQRPAPQGQQRSGLQNQQARSDAQQQLYQQQPNLDDEWDDDIPF